MADTFTQYIIRGISTDTAFNTAVKAYLDTLTATNIDAIDYVVDGHQLICIVVSHA